MKYQYSTSGTSMNYLQASLQCAKTHSSPHLELALLEAYTEKRKKFAKQALLQQKTKKSHRQNRHTDNLASCLIKETYLHI